MGEHVSTTVRRRIDGLTSFARAVLTEAREEQITFMARSVAYSAFVSLLPLLLLAIVVASALGGEAMVESVLSLSEQYLTPTAQETITSGLTQATGQYSFSVLGIATLLWGVLNVFRGLDVAFSSLYGDAGDAGIVDQVRDGLVVLGAITVAVVATVVARVVIALIPDVPLLGLLNALFLVVALTAVFLPMYYVFPDVDVSVREAIPGAAIAAVGFTALQALFGLYVSAAGANELYGAIGGIILLVTWLYFGALVVLLGAAANVVLAGRHLSTQHATRAP